MTEQKLTSFFSQYVSCFKLKLTINQLLIFAKLTNKIFLNVTSPNFNQNYFEGEQVNSLRLKVN